MRPSYMPCVLRHPLTVFFRSGSVGGASIQTYLLEKTRVVCRCPDESNFHIFYQVGVAGFPGVIDFLNPLEF